MIDKIDLMEEQIEAEQQIASGEVVSHEEATIYLQTVWHDRQEPPKLSSGLR